MPFERHKRFRRDASFPPIYLTAATPRSSFKKYDRCPQGSICLIGDTVDLDNATFANTIGDALLVTGSSLTDW
jgi:hypothetical protein